MPWGVMGCWAFGLSRGKMRVNKQPTNILLVAFIVGKDICSLQVFHAFPTA